MAKLRNFPLRYALICSALYGLIAALWIRYSTLVAGAFATSVEELSRIESFKGFAFVIVTTGLFFVFSLSVFRRMNANARALVQSQQRLVQAERDAIAGLISSSIAHDFTNLLTVMRLSLERLKTINDMPAQATEPTAKIDRSIERLTELSSRMRQAGRQVFRERPRFFDVAETLSETLALVKNHTMVRGCSLDVEIPQHIVARGYPILIHQLLMNLVLNACEATSGRGKVLVRASRRNDSVTTIEVHDDGPGIPTHLRDNVFDAFFTTKSYGTGLGLMSVKSCVEICGGSIAIEKSALGGALFKIDLPDIDDARVAQLKVSESLNKITSTIGQTATV